MCFAIKECNGWLDPVQKPLPPLTWFRSFEAAARTLSFTAAAEEIGMTQSAVSQQVKSLELRLGVPLFARKARGLALTDEGRRLLPHVGAAIATLTQATEPYSRGRTPDLLTVASSVSVAQWVISPRLAEFRQAHPEIRLRVLSAVWPDDFQTSQADVEIRFGSKEQAGREAHPLLPNRLMPLKSPRLTGDPDHYPLIETVGTSAGWKAWQARYGPTAEPAFYVDTYGLAMQMAADGNGVALVSELLAKHAIDSGLLEPAFEGAIPAVEGYFLLTHQTRAAAQVFAAWLVACLAR